MKRIVLPLFGLLAVLSLPAPAREVSGAEATRAATRWLQLHPKPLTSQIAPGDVRETRTVKDAAGTALFHIVRLEGGGVVVTSAETGVTPVIAFLDADDIEESSENPLWCILKADLAERNASVAELRGVPAPAAAGDPAAAAALAAAAPFLATTEGEWDALLADAPVADGTEVETPKSLTSISDVRVGPLVHSAWGQKAWDGVNTFNYYTPNNYPCGCVATAGAQVMRYWQWPASAEAGSYSCFVSGAARTLTMMGGAYDWANMPLTKNECTTDTQRKAIGKLVSDLGIASGMAYASGGSGTFGTDMAAALRNRFGYKSAKAVWLENGSGITGNLSTSAEACNAVLAPLDANMPVTLSVYGDGGHHIVADGYGYSGSTLYTHINMGWYGGEYDAWYNLIDESMTNYNFTKLSEVIYNIHPTHGPGDVISGRVTDASGHPVSGATVTLTASGMSPLTARTCPTGIYAFMVSSAGTYTLTARSGNASAQRTVTIAKIGTTAEMNPNGRTASSGSIKTRGSVGNVWGVNFSLDGSAPVLDAPTGVAAADGASTASVAVSWNAVSGATSYAVYRGSNAQASEPVAENVSGTQYADTSATPGVRWYYRVRAFNASGCSDYSDPDDGWRLLTAPATLTATTDSSAAVELSWAASDGATSYTVCRGEAANPTEAIATGVTGTSWSDTSAAVGTTYHYRVKAVSSLCESGYSPDATGRRTAPVDVRLAASDGTSTAHVAITWNAVSGATSYKLFRGTTATATTQLRSGIAGTSFNDTTASPGVRYYYRLKAVTASGDGDYSNSDSGWRALSAPVSLSASDGTSDTAVELTWNAATGATSYRIYRGTAPDPTTLLASGVTGTAYTDGSAVAGVTYYYRLKAVCALGESAYSAADTGYRRTAMSSVLTAADGISAESIHVSWTPVSGATSYFLYRSASEGDEDPVLLDGGFEETFYDDPTATPGKKYWYKIKAKFGSEYSGFSNEDSGYRVLSPPTNLTADKGKSTSNVTVKWSKSVGAVSYNVYRGQNEYFTMLKRGIEVDSYTDETASPGTVYNYYVVAVGDFCRSDVSEDDTGWIKLTAPTLEATPSPSKVGLSWTAVDGALTYTVYRGTDPKSVKTVLSGAQNLSGTTFDDTSAVPEQHYFYKVVAANGNLKSDDSNIAEGWRTPGFFTTMDASDGTSTEKIDVSWTAVEGASTYELWRHTRTDAGVISGEARIAQNLTATSYVDTAATPGVRYWYRLKVYYAGGEISEFCKSDSGYRMIVPPTGLEATQGTLTTGVTVSWGNKPDGTVTFLVGRGTSAGSFSVVGTCAGSKLAYTDTTADPGVRLYYRVAAVGAVCTSEWSAVTSGYRKLAAPGGLTASDGTSDEFVALSWPAVAGATSYNVFRGGESDTLPTNLLANTGTATNAWNDTTAEPGEYYWYRVTAVCALSESDFSKADKGFRSLPAPKNLEATDGGENGIDYFDRIVVRWDAVEGASSYTLFRGTAENPTAVWTNNLADTTFEDRWANAAQTTPLTPGMYYWYAVKANYANGTASTFSNSDSGFIAMSAPTNVVATDGASTANVVLSWNAVNGARSYQISRDNDAEAATNCPTVIRIGQTALSYADAAATNGVPYWYRVRAVGNICTSEWSVVEPGFRMLEAPRTIQATDGTSTSDVTVSWSPVTGAERYLVFRGEGNLADAIDLENPHAEVEANEAVFVDGEVEPGQYYCYRVAAASCICTGAVSAADSGFRAVAGPGDLRASDGLSVDFIEISWSAVSNAATYSIYLGTASNNVKTLVQEVDAGITCYTNYVSTSAPRAGTVYWYQVQARSIFDTLGARSDADSGYLALSAPVLVAGQGTTTASVPLSWQTVPGATSFNLYRCEWSEDIPTNGPPVEPFVLIKDRISGSNTTYADGTATNGILYAYILEACSAAGIRQQCSNVASGWRQIVPPTKLAATDGTSTNEVTVTWTGSAGAVCYEVLRGTNDTQVTTVVATVTNATSFADAAAQPGKYYWYAVRGVGKSGFVSAPSNIDRGHRSFPAPAIEATDGDFTDCIRLSWPSNAFAKSYTVFRDSRDNPTTPLQANLDRCEFTDYSAVPGTLYWYRLRAESEDGTMSEYGLSDSGYRKIEAPDPPTVVLSGTSLRISWTKKTGGTHYIVWRATSPDAADAQKTKLGFWTTGTAYTDSTCEGGVTYWYFVQAAASANGDRPSAIGSGTAGTPPPGNDAFAKAYVLAGPSGTTVGTNNGATRQDNERRHADIDTFATVWWKWTAPANGTNVVDTLGSAFDTVLAVYTGTTLENLISVASDAGGDPDGTSRVVFEATAGTTYRIVVAGRTAADTGTVVLNWRGIGDPARVDPGMSLTEADLAAGHLPVEITDDGFTVKFRSRQGGVTYQLVCADSFDAEDWSACPAVGNRATSKADTSETNTELVVLTAPMDGSAKFYKIKATK